MEERQIRSATRDYIYGTSEPNYILSLILVYVAAVINPHQSQIFDTWHGCKKSRSIFERERIVNPRMGINTGGHDANAP